jgi:sugar lactone lactonase YvrE
MAGLISSGVLRSTVFVLCTLSCSGEGSESSSAANGGAGGTLQTRSRLLFLDIGGGRVLASEIGGHKVSVLVDNADQNPDGIAVDEASGHVYWSNMGVAAADDGSIQRANLDGTNVSFVLQPGGTFTAKQLKVEPLSRKLYWSDREGMRVMRCNLDGSELETIVTIAEGETARADASNWAVGIAVDPTGGHVYWTQKGPDNGSRGSIRRAGIAIPAGQNSRNRADIEVLFEGLPEPIDLDLDLEHKLLYWTDRGDNTVNRAPLAFPANATPAARSDREILVTGLGEAIGIALDLPNGHVYYTDIAGHVGRAGLEGKGATFLLESQGLLTGITLSPVPP